MAYFILFLFSAGLYFFSPDKYNPVFCVVCFIVFLIESLFLLKTDFKRVGPVCFNLFFLFSFFLCSYAFIVFIYPVVGNIRVSLIANPGYFCKCVSLCSLAISSYGLGYYLIHIKNSMPQRQVFSPITSITSKSKFLYAILVFFVVYTLIRFLQSSHEIEIEVQDSPFLFVLLISVLAVYFSSSTYEYVGLKTMASFGYKNAFVLITLLFILILFLIIGDRLVVVESFCLLLAAYSIFHKRVKILTLLVLFLTGTVLMYVIRTTRTSEASLREGNVTAFVDEGSIALKADSGIGAWVYFSDLTGRYSELCSGYEFTENNGHQYPLKIFAVLFSPIPMLPNIVNNYIYGVPLSQTSPGRIVANYTDLNVGSHCVVAAYMPWGVIGTILLFFLFGVLVSWVTICHRQGVLGAALYLTLIAYSVFIPRSSLLDVYRPLVWSIIIYYVLSSFKRN